MTQEAAQHNLDYAKHLEDLGEAHELCDAAQMKEITGSNLYTSGLLTPGTVLIQPAMYCRGLAQGLGNVVSIFENSPVISLDKANGKWLAATNSGSVASNKVILATNGHIESFGYFKGQVFHIMLYGSMTRELTEREAAQTGQPIWGITPSDPVATSMRKISGTGGTRILTRNQMTYAPSMFASPQLLEKMAKRHQTSFVKRYPELSHVEQEYSWSGRLCLSRNSTPAFGKLDDGLFSACCQNGLGTTRGTLSGMAVAELASEGETDLVKSLQKQGKPNNLPPAPLDTIGASAFLKWREFKARKEV